MKQRNFYAILGVPPDADEIEIRDAWKRLAVLHHPDKVGGTKVSNAIMSDLNKIKGVLCDEDSRRAYDAWLAWRETRPSLVIVPEAFRVDIYRRVLEGPPLPGERSWYREIGDGNYVEGWVLV